MRFKIEIYFTIEIVRNENLIKTVIDMKKPSTSDSDEETESSDKPDATRMSDDDEDDKTDNDPLLPRPKSFATHVKSDDDDDDEEEEESKKESVKGEELDESCTEDTLNFKPIKMGDDTDEEADEETDTVSEKIVRQTKSKWSLSNVSSEDETSEEDALSQSSLTNQLEDQIQSWYQEDNLKRPRRLPKAICDSILQDGVDISDLSLEQEDIEKLNADIAKIKNLSLDDLIFKINFYD